jgi:hypothetical protein
MVRVVSSTIAARGVFIEREARINARRSPGVVRCMSNASGNRRRALAASDNTKIVPMRASVKPRTTIVIALK